jgi:hypothetical protein
MLLRTCLLVYVSQFLSLGFHGLYLPRDAITEVLSKAFLYFIFENRPLLQKDSIDTAAEDAERDSFLHFTFHRYLLRLSFFPF